MNRLSPLLLLAVAVAAIAFAVSQSSDMPLSQVLLLLLAGALAQGFASWQAPPPEVIGLERPNWLRQLLAWLLRALIGSAVLALAVAAAWRWVL